MANNLWEEIMKFKLEDEDEEDRRLISKLNEKGIYLDYKNRANDPFFVYLWRWTIDLSDSLSDPENMLEECEILKDVKQSDGKTYLITYRFPNGYDLSCRIDGDIEVFLSNGCCITEAPAIQYVLNEEGDLCILGSISLLPKEAQYITEYEVYFGYLPEPWDEIRGYFRMDEDSWKEIYETTDWEKAKCEIEKEREALRQRYT